jgi:hypothetical protein
MREWFNCHEVPGLFGLWTRSFGQVSADRESDEDLTQPEEAPKITVMNIWISLHPDIQQ